MSLKTPFKQMLISVIPRNKRLCYRLTMRPIIRQNKNARYRSGHFQQA
ncbi:hypothetical protein PFLA_b0211 [Pseudoalteromonas flavipulchra NCIMB 2033 = ATCC BAA-314]|nr:hypothetical protein [Pseudoalteromonas flavipulchra NCIMB 2033 = ATCC BAA-314]